MKSLRAQNINSTLKHTQESKVLVFNHILKIMYKYCSTVLSTTLHFFQFVMHFKTGLIDINSKSFQ